MSRFGHFWSGLLMLTVISPVNALELKLNGISKDKAIALVNGKHRVLRMGERSRDGLLLISVDKGSVTIDYQGQSREYRVGQSIATQYNPAQSRVRQVRIERTLTGMYETGGRINNVPVRMMVDTGATVVAMNALEAQRLGLDYRRVGRPGQVSTASGIETAYFLTLDSVDVGGIAVRNVAAWVLDGQFPQIILLGMSFINRVQMENQGNSLVIKSR